MVESSPVPGPDPQLSGAQDTWPLSAREAALALGVHERTIRRAIARGEIVAAKHGGTFRIARDEVDRYRARRHGHHGIGLGPGFGAPRLIAFPAEHRRLMTPLPHPLTSLIGREGEIADVLAWVQRDDVRLVTLTGPGGVGKTRLAIAVAAATDAFPDGVAFADLAATREAGLVVGTIAQALGIRGRPGRPLVERVAPALRERRVLLVLDNVEHVVDAAPLVTELLGAWPALTVLATSRVRLRLGGEHVHAVPPLALSPGGEGEAVPVAARLFVERAADVRPGAGIGPDDRQVVEAICRRLDGLPLAIELAAARTAALSLRDLLEQLDPRLPVLVDGPRDLPARQRTMRDAIAWSYALLPPAQQALFRALSVFVGGFTLRAAQDVGGRMGQAAAEVLTGLAALVDASLLRLRTDAASPRYLMLETMREFGQEQLLAARELREARDAHAAFYLQLDDWLDPNAIRPGGTLDDRLREIEPEQPNIETALGHLAEVGDVAGVLHLAGQCAIFWHHRAYLAEARRWLEYGLANAPEEPTLDRGNALAGLSLILFTQVEPALARPLAEEALAIGRYLRDDHLTALSLHMLGIIATLELRWADARAHMEASLPLWEQVGERSSVGMALMILGSIDHELGALSRSRERADAALEIFASIGHASGMAFSLTGIGRLDLQQGNRASALRSYQEALRLWAAIGERWGSIRALVGLAAIAASGGQLEHAATLLGVIDQRVAETGGGVFPVDREARDRAAATARAGLGEARFAELLAAGGALATAEVVACAMGITDGGPHRAATPDALSRREREVLRLLVEGRSNAEIAEALYIGVRTARSHVEHILDKLGVPTRTAAATYAVRHNLI